MCRLNSDSQDSECSMSQSQRRCLSHVLRNCGAAIEGVVALVERNGCPMDPDDLSAMIKPVREALDAIMRANARGSFCGLREEQCAYVAPFVGCEGAPR